MSSAILATFFFHKLPRFRKIQCADLNGMNLPTRNTGTLRGKMQLLAMAICQIETTGIEPVSHDIGYHCSTTELCFFFHPQTLNKMIFLESPTITPHGHWSYLSKKFLHKIASELRLYACTNAHKQILIYVRELTIAMLKSDFQSTLGR